LLSHTTVLLLIGTAQGGFMINAEVKSGHFHAVRFYQDSDSLCRIVSGFMAEGLALDQPALIIATQPHIDCIERNLLAAAVDVETLKKKGDLLMLDAHQTLATFMVGGQPDPDFFKAAASSALVQVARGRKKTIRAYGEMVDVLWRENQTSAAIKLEMLWNRLANSHDFSLLCGYAMGNFYKDASIQDVCRHHTHVVSDEGQMSPVAGDASHFAS
jgi:hypothetical protein